MSLNLREISTIIVEKWWYKKWLFSCFICSCFLLPQKSQMTNESAENLFLSWSIFWPIFTFTILRYPIQSFSHFCRLALQSPSRNKKSEKAFSDFFFWAGGCNTFCFSHAALAFFELYSKKIKGILQCRAEKQTNKKKNKEINSSNEYFWIWFNCAPQLK